MEGKLDSHIGKQWEKLPKNLQLYLLIKATLDARKHQMKRLKIIQMTVQEDVEKAELIEFENNVDLHVITSKFKFIKKRVVSTKVSNGFGHHP